MIDEECNFVLSHRHSLRLFNISPPYAWRWQNVSEIAAEMDGAGWERRQHTCSSRSKAISRESKLIWIHVSGISSVEKKLTNFSHKGYVALFKVMELYHPKPSTVLLFILSNTVSLNWLWKCQLVDHPVVPKTPLKLYSFLEYYKSIPSYLILTSNFISTCEFQQFCCCLRASVF